MIHCQLKKLNFKKQVLKLNLKEAFFSSMFFFSPGSSHLMPPCPLQPQEINGSSSALDATKWAGEYLASSEIPILDGNQEEQDRLRDVANEIMGKKNEQHLCFGFLFPKKFYRQERRLFFAKIFQCFPFVTQTFSRKIE